jgi:murein DD-endopeptidase MepM/ murein hydrolase activator NlpD
VTGLGGGEEEVALTIARGDTLVGALLRTGIARDDALDVVAALEDLFDPRDLRTGDRIALRIEGGAADRRHLRSLHLATGRRQDLTLVAGADGSFAATPLPLARGASLALRTLSGQVTQGFRDSLAAAGLPRRVVAEVLASFANDPDLTPEPATGSRFTVVFEAIERPGAPAALASLRYASLRTGTTEHRVYRYRLRCGDVAYVDPSGRGVLPLNLRRPIANAAITSPWGWRMHPVLGVPKFHRGVDFGATAGTPVHAAADGTIEEFGWRGNYGRYVRLHHSDRLETAYAHLSRFAQRLRSGSRVREGEVVGFVGASGLATGPHLYFEVWLDHRPVDPDPDRLAVPIQVSGRDLTRFRSYLAHVYAQAS